MFYVWKYQKPVAKLDKVTDKLFISNVQGASERKLLDEHKITHIVVAGNNLEMKFPSDFKYLHLPLDDLPSQKLKPYFKQAFDFIEEGERVLIHCAAGISRSSSILIAYLMMKEKLKFSDAHNLVKKSRSMISPNHGFVIELKELEKVLEKEGYDLIKIFSAEIEVKQEKEDLMVAQTVTSDTNTSKVIADLF